MSEDTKEFLKFVGGFVLVAFVVIGLVFSPIVMCSNAALEADCRTICETRHTHMVDVSDFGCLCDDGSLVQSPQHTTVMPVVVSH